MRANELQVALLPLKNAVFIDVDVIDKYATDNNLTVTQLEELVKILCNLSGEIAIDYNPNIEEELREAEDDNDSLREDIDDLEYQNAQLEEKITEMSELIDKLQSIADKEAF